VGLVEVMPSAVVTILRSGIATLFVGKASINLKIRDCSSRYYVQKLVIAISILVLGTVSNARAAATYTSTQSGPWNTATTWTVTGVDATPNGGIPDADDIVVINGGFVVTLGVGETESCSSLSLGQNGGATTTALTFSSGSVLTVSGAVSLSGSKPGTIDMTNGGTLKIGSTFSNAGTFTAGSGTVEYNALGVQSVLAQAYNNLILSGSGAKTIPTGTTVTGNLSIQPAGSTATANLGAGVNINPVGTLTLGGTTRVSGSWGSTTSGATNQSNSFFAGAGKITVSVGAANKLVVTTQPSPSTVTGIAFAQQPIVQIQDAAGAVVTSGPDSTLVVTVALTTGTGTLSGTLTKTAIAGVADFSGQNLSIDLVGNNKVLTFTTTGGVTSTTTSPAFAITTATATKLAITLINGGANPIAGTAFNVVVRSEDASGNFTNVVANTNVTLSLNTGGGTLGGTLTGTINAGTSTLTISGVTYTKAESGVILTATRTAGDALAAANSAAFTVNAGAFAKLQLLVPGEVAAPGTATGKTAATPSGQTAGSAFSVIVNAVDANWNVVSSTDTIAITSTNAHFSAPANAALVAGTKTFSVTFTTAAASTITATDITDGTKTANTSPSIAVGVGAFAKLQLLVPGEVADPGSATGKTAAAPSGQTAGTAFSVIANAVDANWNAVSSTDTIAITSTNAHFSAPANAALVAGTKTFSVTFTTAAASTITATDNTDGTKTANTSPSIAVSGGAFAKLQLLVPGEVADPGSATGKTAATPSGQTAGTAFSVIVNAVDANWNVVSSTDTIAITSTNAHFSAPANAALVAGTKTFSVTFTTAAASTITATDNTDGTKTANTSPSIAVSGGAFAKLQLLVPGEVADPGSATGKTSATPSGQTAGTAFSVIVNAVDANWNVVSSTDTIAITSTNAHFSAPANAALVAGTKTFSVTFTTAAASTITATDNTDGTKTANTSPSIAVSAGAFAKLQLLVPGEVADPGSATGKTVATPSAQIAGIAFSVIVNAVDANWNVVSAAPANTITLTSSDGSATMPGGAALAAGTVSFASVTLVTAGPQTITATNTSDGTKTANTSPTITVNNPVPTLVSIAPISGIQDQTLDVVFNGTGFFTGASSVSFSGGGITLNSTTVNSSIKITANITIAAGAATGFRDVSVINALPGGGTATLVGAFEVQLAVISIVWDNDNSTAARSWALGPVTLATARNTTTDGITNTLTIRNDAGTGSNTPVKLSISSSGSGAWTKAASAGPNKFEIKADGNNDATGGAATNPAKYELDVGAANQTLNASLAIGATQTLGLYFKTPTTTSTVAQQTITVTITATLP
jgi:fibrillarin-like rRNA methylase